MSLTQLNQASWIKKGGIITPDKNSTWFVSHVGSSCILSHENNLVSLIITGRDCHNQSRLGILKFDPENVDNDLVVDSHPILELGTPNEFDHSGTSYPFVITINQQDYLYYVGWQRDNAVPFINQIGIAKLTDNKSEKIKNGLNFSNDDSVSKGSFCILYDEGCYKMWYTSFRQWQQLEHGQRHIYHIRYAISDNGFDWQCQPQVAIDFAKPDEYAIAHPTVYRDQSGYHMWYCVRGDNYQLGYAFSKDGVEWQRDLTPLDFIGTQKAWDNQSQCYPRVFTYKQKRYLLYAGNEYGKTGLGLAVLNNKE